jgi:mono/diheme cytochrome c family protein
MIALAAPVAAQDLEAGRALFRAHCATCHGLEARGDGPMAGVLLIKPVNLTELAAGSGGDFPMVRVIRRIDGRDPLVSHGSPMPVYGDYFEGGYDRKIKTPDGALIETSRPVLDLVGYLQSIQTADE